MALLPNLRRMMIIYRGNWKWIALSQIFVLLSAFFMLLIPVQIATLINLGVITGNISVIVDSALTMLFFAILAGAFAMANLYVAALVGEGTAHYLRTIVYEKIQTFSFGNLDTYPVGEMLVRLTNDIYQINMAANYATRYMLYAPFMILIALVFVYIGSPSLVWIFLLVIIITAVLFGVISLVLQKQYQERQRTLDAENNVLQEDFAGVRVIKSFVMQDYENKRFEEKNENFRLASLSPLRTMSLQLPSIFLILGLSNALVIWYGGMQVIAGVIEVGEIVAFTQYFFFILAQLWILSYVLPQIIAAEASGGRLAELIDTVPTVLNAPDAEALIPGEIKGRVEFENVSFSYDGPGGKEAVKNISFTAEPGTTVAFLGPTGSGKSTLINLIPRFYDTTEGRITIDGHDIKKIPQDKLRTIVDIALQESVLFSGTIHENIAFADQDMTYEQVREASLAADADGFVSAIPGDYKSRVARKGTNFSGGQRQRLSIARAIAPHPKILILDDSTSAVDVATESRIQAAMSTLMKETTIFMVAQRISTVLTADTIILLDQGEIVDKGNHSELMGRSTLYREIFESQLGGIRKEDVS
ncbi:ABC transporter ATP-binding protein [Methanoplanus endosymbiosus]|uniref:ABC transporter ATP-binding protein/permease n=1 Tax=Methanoplanus endosymbiosus TaxID=33865 RepID=A0A9E7TIT8_9EURY|nr:ABC transporter ATP-binding protein [Methanoplanus endosymbiosus]UUX91169.1 ABC transporter ATP-binding protein/permease [Methanoplanus endosymbiosus]